MESVCSKGVPSGQFAARLDKDFAWNERTRCRLDDQKLGRHFSLLSEQGLRKPRSCAGAAYSLPEPGLPPFSSTWLCHSLQSIRGLRAFSIENATPRTRSRVP